MIRRRKGTQRRGADECVDDYEMIGGVSIMSTPASTGFESPWSSQDLVDGRQHPSFNEGRGWAPECRCERDRSRSRMIGKCAASKIALLSSPRSPSSTKDRQERFDKIPQPIWTDEVREVLLRVLSKTARLTQNRQRCHLSFVQAQHYRVALQSRAIRDVTYKSETVRIRIRGVGALYSRKRGSGFAFAVTVALLRSDSYSSISAIRSSDRNH